MMKGDPSDLGPLHDLKTATAFLAYVCVWSIAGTVDAAAWWVDEKGRGHRRVLITGESIDFRPPKVVADQVIDPSTVDTLVAEFCALGGEHLTSQLVGSAPWNNFDIWYGVRRSAQVESRWIPVMTGYHDTENELDLLLSKFVHSRVPEFSGNEA